MDHAARLNTHFRIALSVDFGFMLFIRQIQNLKELISGYNKNQGTEPTRWTGKTFSDGLR